MRPRRWEPAGAPRGWLALLLAAACGLGAGGAPPELRRDEIMRDLSRLRGREYRHPIASRTLRAGQVRSFLLRKLHDEYPPDRLEAERRTMVHFGFLEPGDDLEDLFVSMLTDQAAGYYDPDQANLVLVKGVAFPGMALVHELAHALQDQTFGIRAILDRARDDGDALLAAQAMIEGEAALLTEKRIASRGAVDPPEGAQPGPARAGGRSPRIPRVLQRTFIFPYVEGLAWARAVDERGGNALMDRLFLAPPDSTEQILHPDRTAPARDLPSVIDPSLFEPAAREAAQAGFRPLRSDVMGEFLLRELLGAGSPEAVAAAQGWDADRYALYVDAAGRTAMAWVTVWDDEADAGEFLAGLEGWLAKRQGPGPTAGRWRTGRAGRPARIVWAIEGFGEEASARLESSLSASLGGGVTFR